MCFLEERWGTLRILCPTNEIPNVIHSQSARRKLFRLILLIYTIFEIKTILYLKSYLRSIKYSKVRVYELHDNHTGSTIPSYFCAAVYLFNPIQDDSKPAINVTKEKQIKVFFYQISSFPEISQQIMYSRLINFIHMPF